MVVSADNNDRSVARAGNVNERAVPAVYQNSLRENGRNCEFD